MLQFMGLQRVEQDLVIEQQPVMAHGNQGYQLGYTGVGFRKMRKQCQVVI